MAAIMGIPQNPLQRDIGQYDANAALRRQTQLALMQSIIGTMNQQKRDEAQYRRQRELYEMQNAANLERERLRGELDIERAKVVTDAAFEKQAAADKARELSALSKLRIPRNPGETDDAYIARVYDERATELADQRYETMQAAEKARAEISEVLRSDQIAQQAKMQEELDRKTRGLIQRWATNKESKADAANPNVNIDELLADIAANDANAHNRIASEREKALTVLQEKYSKPSQEAAVKAEALNRRAQLADRAELEIQKEFMDVPGAQRAFRERLGVELAPPPAQGDLVDPETGQVIPGPSAAVSPDMQRQQEDVALLGLVQGQQAQEAARAANAEAMQAELAAAQSAPMGAIPQAARVAGELPAVAGNAISQRVGELAEPFVQTWQGLAPVRDSLYRNLWSGAPAPAAPVVPVSPQGTPIPMMPELSPPVETYPGNEQLIRVPMRPPEFTPQIDTNLLRRVPKPAFQWW